MLRFVFTDLNGKSVTAFNPVSLDVNMEQGVPCDDMSAVFAYFDCDELVEVKLFDDDKALFYGIIDEQQILSSASGEYIKIVARSMASKLVDNESEPISYMHPDTFVIESHHITPFGLKTRGENVTFYGTQTVLKGQTNWQAIEDFSKNAYNSTVRVNEYGEVDFSGSKKDSTVVFSNDGDGIPYTKFTQVNKRCEEISKVRIKVTNSCGYNSVVENKDATKRKIQRERYLNSVLTDTPVEYADKMIKNGREKAYYITLECVGQHLAVFNSNAKVKNSICKDIDNLYVSSIRYQLSSKKDVTIVTLKRKEV